MTNKISEQELRIEFPQFFEQEKEKVGGKALEGFSKIRHKKPMLSGIFTNPQMNRSDIPV